MALSKSPFTLRVFSAGLLLCLLISAATPYTNILAFYLYGILYRRAALVQRISSLVVQDGRAQVRGVAATPHGMPLLYGPNFGTVLQRRVLAHRRRVYRYYRQWDRRALPVQNPLRQADDNGDLAGVFIGYSLSLIDKGALGQILKDRSLGIPSSEIAQDHTPARMRRLQAS